MSRIPLIIILGATGSGKSKLAIEIAKKYGGGTNYYIESILWKVLVEDRNLKRPLSIDDIEVGAQKKWKSAEEFAEQTGPELHSQLEKVDPDRAKTLHPNDRRKIIRQVDL
uniref:Uncharacterized protein n=1 Tax=Timema poppense TaxID=170557 RepID=A0A7R9H251_TIMPO|nr:unnamed protein product [Timema poppensis]